MAHIPYGYRIVGGKAEIDPYEADTLRQLYRHYLSGRTAAAAARDAGFPDGCKNIRGLLSNPVYLGSAYYPRIIDDDLYRRVQDERKRRSPPSGTTRSDPASAPIPIYTRFTYDPTYVPSDADPIQRAEQIYCRIIAFPAHKNQPGQAHS